MARLRLSEDSTNPQTVISDIPNTDNSELQAILTQTIDQEVCLLRDSPFRILRVSFIIVDWNNLLNDHLLLIASIIIIYIIDHCI